jgi:small-conductance mechanosensitive channel
LILIYSAISLLEKTGIETVVSVLIIINIAWILIAFLNALEEIVWYKFQIDGEVLIKERKAMTQLRFIKSITIVIVVTLAIASVLWNIPAARELGKTILTSAGVVGIIVGVAAQKSIANLITGLQIAFTQPIKIDDEVVVENEFGTVEDVTLTYVVIKTWDWRRLVLPLSYFNEHPFRNWSFNSRDLIGTVFFYVDYTFPVEALRKKLLEVLRENPLWDKDIAQLLVTDSSERSMQLRASFSSKNASELWRLRCSIREDLITFIQETHPNALPKLRMSGLS